MRRDINSVVTLNNGLKIPQLGFGTALISEDDEQKTIDVILTAIDAGYRHFDTAAKYDSERALGNAIKQSGIKREEFFITTKIWNDDLRKDRYKEALYESLDKLQMDYVDMYMIHWPVMNKYVRAYMELVPLYKEGLTHSLGVSCFVENQIEQILMCTDVVPVVNQVECNPMFARESLFAYCKSKGIMMQACRPLGQGAYLNDTTLGGIAQKHNKSIVQIILRWHMQRGVIAIPKSAHEKYIRANVDIYDFELDTDDELAIARMNVERGTSPYTSDCFDF